MGGLDDPRTREGVEHLQTAARELIAAARAFLDVAEDAVADPAAVQDWARTAGDIWQTIVGSTATEPDGHDSGDDARVEHIPVR